LNVALQLLFGPSVLRLTDDTQVVVSVANQYPRAMYDDEVGLAATGTGLGMTVSQLDGATYSRASGSFSFGLTSVGTFILDLTSPANEWMVIDSLFNDKIYAFDRTTGIVGDLIIDTGATNGVLGAQARANDRWLYFLGPNVKSCPLDFSDNFSNEAPLVGVGNGVANVSRTRRRDTICLIYVSGEVVYYDYVLREQVGDIAFVGANVGAWYSPRHDVFVVLTETTAPQYLSVYANSVAPTSISAPDPDPPLTRGRVSTIRVTVTGSHSDACVGELIDWELSGPGALLAQQSTTDAQGIARVGYVAPITLSTDPTITASLTI
jgi:hypothetical protein